MIISLDGLVLSSLRGTRLLHRKSGLHPEDNNTSLSGVNLDPIAPSKDQMAQDCDNTEMNARNLASVFLYASEPR